MEVLKRLIKCFKFYLKSIILITNGFIYQGEEKIARKHVFHRYLEEKFSDTWFVDKATCRNCR